MIYASLAIFLVYVLNVALGAMGHARFLNDVQECLVLLLATLLFVIDILGRERRNLATKTNTNP